jgi:micrococcal nuclease
MFTGMASDFQKLLQRGPNNAAPFKRPRTKGWAKRATWKFVSAIIVLPLSAFSAVFFWGGGPKGMALPIAPGHVASVDRESARFGQCWGPARANCVVDGDTFWYRGEKFRIADINTPEVSDPDCAYEARLGERATLRLVELLNVGPFALESIDRDRDRYGRLLRVVSRGGRSLGDALVAEGLAERWQGRRGDWCAGTSPG